jgi:hypothetical protein
MKYPDDQEDSDDQEDEIVNPSPVLKENDIFFHLFYSITRILPETKKKKTNLLIEKKQERIIYPGVKKC